jgi:hypothetical protein
VVTSDGLHLVAYIGDADGSGSYSSADAVLITRALLSADTGFTAYPLVDPVIVSDTDGAGFIPADATLQANEAGVGLPAPNLPIPPILIGVHFRPIGNNVDPEVSIPSELHVGAAGTVTVPVNIDDAHPAGSTGLLRGHLALTYDPNDFAVSVAGVHPGSLLAGGGWSIVPIIDPATGQIAITLSGDTPITSTQGGSLVTLTFQSVGGNANPSSITLVPSATPNGQFITTELEDAQGAYTLSQGNSVVMLTSTGALLPAPVLRVLVHECATLRIEPSSDSREDSPAIVERASGPAAVIAGPGDSESASVPTPVVEEPLHVAAAPPHGTGTIMAATSVSLAAVPLTSLMFPWAAMPLAVALANVVLGWLHLADQLFQALARTTWHVNDPVLVGAVPGLEYGLAGQMLLGQAPADLIGFSWDR